MKEKEQPKIELKYDCGCIYVNSVVDGLRSRYLCKKHYKEVANHNAMHKLIPARVVKLKKPRWDLII